MAESSARVENEAHLSRTSQSSHSRLGRDRARLGCVLACSGSGCTGHAGRGSRNTRQLESLARNSLALSLGLSLSRACAVFIDVFEKFGVPITMEEARGPMGQLTGRGCSYGERNHGHAMLTLILSPALSQAPTRRFTFAS